MACEDWTVSAGPNVQALAQTMRGSNEQVPERFVRTEEVCAEEVVAGCVLPVVDLGRLIDPRSTKEELANLGAACQKWDFFQLINHGVPDEMIQDARRDIAEFFKLPLEAKKAYAQLPESGLEGYGQAFVFSEAQKLDWSDMLYLMLRPTESRDMTFWPAQPPSFRSSVDTYSAEARRRWRRSCCGSWPPTWAWSGRSACWRCSAACRRP